MAKVKAHDEVPAYLQAPEDPLTTEEREWIREVSGRVAALDEAPVLVHLGSGRGASLYASAAGAGENACLVGVDLKPERWWGDLQVELIAGDSRLAWREFEWPVHFLFVDADHEEGSVLAELIGWSPKVVPSGVMAFHDYGNDHLRWCRGVKAAVDAWDWSGWEEVPAAGSIKAFRRLDAVAEG